LGAPQFILERSDLGFQQGHAVSMVISVLLGYDVVLD